MFLFRSRISRSVESPASGTGSGIRRRPWMQAPVCAMKPVPRPLPSQHGAWGVAPVMSPASALFDPNAASSPRSRVCSVCTTRGVIDREEPFLRPEKFLRRQYAGPGNSLK